MQLPLLTILLFATCSLALPVITPAPTPETSSLVSATFLSDSTTTSEPTHTQAPRWMKCRCKHVSCYRVCFPGVTEDLAQCADCC
jgi:hypothetical protein